MLRDANLKRSLINWFGSILLLTIVVIISPATAAGSSWNEVLNHSGVVLEQRQLPGHSYQQTQGRMIFSGRIDSLLTILNDVRQCVYWLNDCKHSKVVKQLSPSERIDYTVMDAPFMLQDRDMYIRSKVSYDRQTKTATISLRGVENFDKGMPNRVRVKALQGFWRFQQLDEQRVKVDYRMYNDPQVVPVAAVNATTPKSVLNTFVQLRKLASSPKFRNSRISQQQLQQITTR